MLETRPLDVSDAEIDQVSALLAGVFSVQGHIDAAYLRWCYRENPAGTAVGYNAWDGDRLAAHYVMSRFERGSMANRSAASCRCTRRPTRTIKARGCSRASPKRPTRVRRPRATRLS